MKTELTGAVLALCLGAALAAPPKEAPREPAPMTRQAYEAARAKIAADFRADGKLCSRVKGQAKAVCETEAKGKRRALEAELEAKYQPSPEASFKAKTVTAEANYDVARKKCDGRKGDAKDRCVKEAKLAREAAIRQAKVEKVQETGGAFGASKGRGASAS